MNNIFVRISIWFFAFQFINLNIAAQQEPRTFKVKKESNLAKAVFDNVDLRLMVIDVYGNPKDNNIVGYKLYVKNKRETKVFDGFNNQLTTEMVSYLNKQTKAVKIFFTNVLVKDDNAHLINLPDVIDVWFPSCVNCKPDKRKKH